MKFFHVYNEEYFEGLVKNGLINKDSGFKIQHVFSMPDHLKFNELAKRGGKLHSYLKENNFPFYVDRIAGGVTYHEYAFDKELTREYLDMLGDWFLGFQLHESASNRNNDWRNLMRYMNGSEGPYDLEQLRRNSIRKKATTPNGTPLPGFAQGTPEEYAPMRRARTVGEFVEEIRAMYGKYMKATDGLILPCDSYYLFSNMQGKLGMRTFMPEVGCQIGQMRVAVATARGAARTFGRTWGTYYETWMESQDHKYSMPCFNKEPGNEWYLSQEQHADDFTSYGEKGGSSRYLQKRIYYYSLMSGADYMAEEWGLNCSYNSMISFELSPYGLAKKDFIDFALKAGRITARVPFAIVLPSEYEAPEVLDIFGKYRFGEHRSTYMLRDMNDTEAKYVNHAEDVLKLFFGRDEDCALGTEGHTITNSRFGDLFDIINEDAPEEVLRRYDALIDASCDSGFAKAKKGCGLEIFESLDFERLAHEIDSEAKRILPVTVDGLHWVLSFGEGKRYLTIFNNEGNERSLLHGDRIIKDADRVVTLSFAQPCELSLVKHGFDAPEVTRKDKTTYTVKVPAAGFAIFEY